MSQELSHKLINSSARADALAELEQLQSEGTRKDRPERLPLAEIQREEAFCVRGEGLQEAHLSDLSYALKSCGDLDPILVVACGQSFYLLDGHHRLEAYRRAKHEDIPVTHFEGSPRDALAHRSREAWKSFLPLTPHQRQNLAWDFVLGELFSINETACNTGISVRQVSIMRKAKKTLGDAAFGYLKWWEARRAAEGPRS